MRLGTLKGFRTSPRKTGGTRSAHAVYPGLVRRRASPSKPFPRRSETPWKQEFAQSLRVALGAKEAESILSFCATGKQARAVVENGQCAVLMRSDGRTWRFEGATFEDALRAGAEAGQLRRSCIDKQIAFWGRHAERPKDVISRVLMTELGAARGRIVEREIVARVGRPLSELSPVESTTSRRRRRSCSACASARSRRRAWPGGSSSRPAARCRSPRPRRARCSSWPGASRAWCTRRRRSAARPPCCWAATASASSTELGEQRAETDRWIADLGSFTVAEAELPPGDRDAREPAARRRRAGWRRCAPTPTRTLHRRTRSSTPTPT